MRILFDHGVPEPLRVSLSSHSVVQAKTRGWDRLTNGDLIQAVERAGFDLFLTTDKRIRYQWTQAVESIGKGDYLEVEIPYE